jgi:hypothetical protein
MTTNRIESTTRAYGRSLRSVEKDARPDFGTIVQGNMKEGAKEHLRIGGSVGVTWRGDVAANQRTES